MADVSAKDGSQETLVNLTALVCSLVIVPLVSDNPLYYTLIPFIDHLMIIQSIVWFGFCSSALLYFTSSQTTEQ